jgi:F-type H+-transporting ATPase subunit b
MSRQAIAISGSWMVVAAVAVFLVFGSWTLRPLAAAEAQETKEHGAATQATTGSGSTGHGPTSEEEKKEEAAEMVNPISPTPSLAIWTVVVFIGLLGVLARFAWKPLIAALQQREEHLEHVLQETERVRNESEALLAEHRRRMASTEEEVRAMIAQAKADAQAMSAEIARQAAAEAEATRQRATRDISSAKDQALAEIWTRTADIAVSVAGKVLAKSVGPDEHKRLVEAAINELPSEASPNGHAVGGQRA